MECRNVGRQTDTNNFTFILPVCFFKTNKIVLGYEKDDCFPQMQALNANSLKSNGNMEKVTEWKLRFGQVNASMSFFKQVCYKAQGSNSTAILKTEKYSCKEPEAIFLCFTVHYVNMTLKAKLPVLIIILIQMVGGFVCLININRFCFGCRDVLISMYV